MTPEQACAELLGRIGANNGATVLVSEEELTGWPSSAVNSMKAAGLLVPASPASSVACPGCEQECSMPVVDRSSSREEPVLFVVCDKRLDINRVTILPSKLRLWTTSSLAVAALISRLLSLTGSVSSDGSRCEVGTLRGRKHSSHIVLIADGKLRLGIAGHVVDLDSVLTLMDAKPKVDRRTLERFVDNPVAGGGDRESARDRKARLLRAAEVERSLGNKSFLKTLAQREGISTQRIKQLLTAASSER
jgi:hypothetical protein